MLAIQPILQKDIQDLINTFKEILCLHHWKIKYRLENDADMKHSLMKVIPNRDRSLATILIRKSLVGKSTGEFGPLLLHELVHLILEPIVEEHACQLHHEVPEVRIKEYEERFRRLLEKVVEHLTNQIAPLLIFVAVAADEVPILNLEELRTDNEALKTICAHTSELLDTYSLNKE